MSTKHFCDGCGAQLADGENYGAANLLGTHTRRRLPDQVTPTKIRVEVGASVEGVKDVDLCRGCVIDAVMAADTRTREDDGSSAAWELAKLQGLAQALADAVIAEGEHCAEVDACVASVREALAKGVRP